MPNYNLKYNVSEVARIFNVERDLIKTWSYIFSEYLSKEANPRKGKQRTYTVVDICTFGYIMMYWEDDPDIENIKLGLNSGDQYEQPYSELAKQYTPIFREFDEDIIEYKQIVSIGGITENLDTFSLADAYKLAGDILIQTALEKDEEFELRYPVMYNYRHATELYLKSIIGKKLKSHDLSKLLDDFKVIVKKKFNAETPEWFDNIIIAFNEFDPGGTLFRYGGNQYYNEMFVDLRHLGELMGWLADSLSKVKRQIVMQ
jgi:hypothetical protein